MAGAATEQLIIELDARTQKLEAGIKSAEAEIRKFARNVDATATTANNSGMAADRLATKYANGARVIAGAAETASRAGKLTGEATKQLISQGSLMATMFGPTGAILGAVGIFGVAMVNIFNRARDEAKRTREAFEDEFGKISDLSSAAAAGEGARRLFQGSQRPAITDAGRALQARLRSQLIADDDAAGFGRAFGIPELRERIALMQQTIQQQAAYGNDVDDLRDKLVKWQNAERDLAALHAEHIELVKVLGREEGERATSAARIADEERRRKEMGQEATAEQRRREQLAAQAAEQADVLARKLNNLILGHVEDAVLELQNRLRTTLDELDREQEAIRGKDPTLAAATDSAFRARRAEVEALFRAEIAGVSTVIRLERELADVQERIDEGRRLSADDLARVVAQEAELSQLIESSAEGSKERAAFEARLASLQRTRRAIQSDITEQQKKSLAAADAAQRVAYQQLQADEQRVQRLREQARAAVDVARGILGAAQAAGLLDDRVAATAHNLLTVGSGIEEALTGNMFSGASQILGGLAGAVAGLMDSDPVRQEQIEATRHNTEALRELARRAGDLAAFTGTGQQLSGARTAIQRSLEGENFGILERNLRDVGLSIGELREILRSVGIELPDTLNREVLQQALDALDSFDWQAFAESFAGGLELIQARWALFRTDDPLAKLGDYLALLADPQKGAPALFGALGDLDASTAAGREAIQALIQRIFEDLASGDIDPALFGGMTRDQIVDAILGIGDFLNDVGDAEEAAAEAAADAERARRQRRRTQLSQEFEVFDIDDPVQRLQRMSEVFGELFPEIQEILAGLDLTSPKGVAELEQRLQQLWLSLDPDNLPAGMTQEMFAELIAAILDLENAADEAATGVTSAADKIAGALNKIQLDAEILGISAEEVAQRTGTALGFDLSGFDLSTAAGREAARQFLRDIFQSDPTRGEDIVEILRRINAIPDDDLLAGDITAAGRSGSGSAAVSAARGLTEISGNLLVDFNRQTARNTREMAVLMRSVFGRSPTSVGGADGVSPAAAGISSVIVPPSWIGGGGAAGNIPSSGPATSSQPNITIAPTFVVQVSSELANPEGTGALVGAQAAATFADQADKQAFKQAILKKLHRGDITHVGLS